MAYKVHVATEATNTHVVSVRNSAAKVENEPYQVLERTSSSILFGSTDYWQYLEEDVPKKGTILVYTDHKVEDGKNCPAIKIADGLTKIKDIAFISEGDYIELRAALNELSSSLSGVAFSGSYNDLSDKPDIPIIPANVSEFVNDADYATRSELPTVPTNISAFTNDAGYLTEHQSLAGYTKDIDLATVAKSGSYNDLSGKPTIPSTTSQLANNSGFITKAVSDLVNYYKKTEVDGMISSIPKFAIEVVEQLPTTNISNTTVYLVKEWEESPNLYTEYIYVGTNWEQLGKQDVDLSGYATKVYVDDIVDDLRLFKFPNANIVGEPLIESGNISRFSASDYLVFPFVVDVKNNPFEITMCFTTGNDVTTQQNILDSYFGMALAIQNGKGIMALSSNGTGWDIGLGTGVIPIYPNRTYYAKVSWDGSAYKTALSQDGVTYVDDMYAGTSVGLNPTTMYIGASPNIFGAGSAHPFGGTINMNKCHLSVAGLEVWQGMDDAGLSTRADLSLGNLDAEGEKRFSDRYTKIEADNKFALKTELPTVPANVSELTNDVGYVTSTDFATTTKAGVIKRGNWITLSDDGKLEAGELTKTQYDSASGKTFIGKTTLENILSSVAKSGSYNDLTDKPNIPTIPTNVSSFTNDAGYLTEHQSLSNYATKTFVSEEFARQLALIDGNEVAY